MRPNDSAAPKTTRQRVALAAGKAIVVVGLGALACYQASIGRAWMAASAAFLPGCYAEEWLGLIASTVPRAWRSSEKSPEQLSNRRQSVD
jgi:hypothetical protein